MKLSLYMPRRHVGEWTYSWLILNFSTRWRWVVRFTLWGKSPRYPLNKGVGGPQSRCGESSDKRKISRPCRESNRDFSFRPVVQSLYRARYPDTCRWEMYTEFWWGKPYGNELGRLRRICKVDRTGSQKCPVAEFCNSGVQPWCCTASEFSLVV